jgi:hypothetical protein
MSSECDLENEIAASADKQFSREKVSSIVQNTERALIKKLTNTVINEFNTFIHSPDSINKYAWEYKLSCHTSVTSLIFQELLHYFEDGMCTVLPTGDPYVVSVRIIWY